MKKINKNLAFPLCVLSTLATSIVGVVGCCCPSTAKIDFSKLDEPPQMRPRLIEKPYADEVRNLNRDERNDWGMALSGGGTRSAIFCIGAMKAIYDIDQGQTFRKIDVISSVSGGGYASYWLYSNEFKKGGGLFGEASFSEDNYGHNLIQIYKNRKMYPISRMLAYSLVPRSLTVKDYENRIHKTFGGGLKARLKFQDLGPIVKDRSLVPYPIFNATVCAKNFKGKRVSKNYEFSINHFGNPELGIDQSPAIQDFRVSRAVAISGAAFAPFLRQYHYPSINHKKFSLSDGGHNENLGVIALVRRGVKNIIVLDAEHSANYEFDGYEALKENLECIGLTIKIDEIDSYLKSNVRYNDNKPIPSAIYTEGKIVTMKGCKHMSNVIYVKMAIDQTMKDAISKKVAKELESNFKDGQLCPTSKLNLNRFKSAKSASLLSNASHCKRTVYYYSQWLNNCSKWRYMPSKLTFGKYSFPQTSTADQSFQYPDQLSSFLALGYLQGEQLEGILRNSRR